MRTPIIAGNWKMNNTAEESRTLIHEIIQGIREIKNVSKIIFPPFTSIIPAASLLVGSDIELGAQDIHWEEKGAYTGEISPVMIAEFCSYTLVGHSERRAYFGETDEMTNLKMKAAINYGLIPILCIGETLEEKKNNLTASILERQLDKGYKNIELEHAYKSIIAYEPVWAIGSGLPSSGNDVQKVISEVIRPNLEKKYCMEFASSIQILYGGSVNSENANEFFLHEDIDGALVGGASLKAEQFIRIVEVCSEN